MAFRKSEMFLDTIRDYDPQLKGARLTTAHFRKDGNDSFLTYNTLNSKIKEYRKRAIEGNNKMIKLLIMNSRFKSSTDWKDSFDVVYSSLEHTFFRIHSYHKKYPAKMMLMWHAFYDIDDMKTFCHGFLNSLDATSKNIDDFFSLMLQWIECSKVESFSCVQSVNTKILEVLKSQQPQILEKQPDKYISFIEKQGLYGNLDWLLTELMKPKNMFLISKLILPNLESLSTDYTSSKNFTELCIDLIYYDGKLARKYIKEFYLYETGPIPIPIQEAFIEHDLKPINNEDISDFSSDSESDEDDSKTEDVMEKLDEYLLGSEADFDNWVQEIPPDLYSHNPIACFLLNEIYPDYSLCSTIPEELKWLNKCRNTSAINSEKYESTYKFDLLDEICNKISLKNQSTNALTSKLKTCLTNIAITITPDKFSKWSILRILKKENNYPLADNDYLEQFYFENCVPEIKKSSKLQSKLKNIYKKILNTLQKIPNNSTKMLCLSLGGNSSAEDYLKLLKKPNYIPAIKYLIVFHPQTVIQRIDIETDSFNLNQRLILLKNIAEIWNISHFNDRIGMDLIAYKLLLKFLLEVKQQGSAPFMLSEFTNIYTTFCANQTSEQKFSLFLNDFKEELVSVCYPYPHETRLTAFELLFPIASIREESKTFKQELSQFRTTIESELFLKDLCSYDDFKQIPKLDEKIVKFIEQLIVTNSVLCDWDLWVVTLVKCDKVSALEYIKQKLEDSKTRSFESSRILDKSNTTVLVLFKADSFEQAESVFKKVFPDETAEGFQENIVKITLLGLKWMTRLLETRPIDEFSYRKVLQGYFMILKANSVDFNVFQILRDKFFDCLRYLKTVFEEKMIHQLFPETSKLFVECYTFFIKHLIKITQRKSPQEFMSVMNPLILDWFCDCYNMGNLDESIINFVLKQKEGAELKFLIANVPEFAAFKSNEFNYATQFIPSKHFIESKSKIYRKFFLKALLHHLETTKEKENFFDDSTVLALQNQLTEMHKLCDEGKKLLHKVFIIIGQNKCKLFEMKNLKKRFKVELPINLPYSEEFGVFIIEFIWRMIFKQNSDFKSAEDFIILGDQLQKIYERDFPNTKKEYSHALVEFLEKQKIWHNKIGTRNLEIGMNVFAVGDIRRVFIMLAENFKNLAEMREYDDEKISEDDSDEMRVESDTGFSSSKNQKITKFMIKFFSTFGSILSKSLINSEKLIGQILSPCLLTFCFLVDVDDEDEKSMLTKLLQELYRYPTYLFNFQKFVDDYHHRFHKNYARMNRFNISNIPKEIYKDTAASEEAVSGLEIKEIQELSNSINKKQGSDSLIEKYCKTKYDKEECDSQDEYEEDHSELNEEGDSSKPKISSDFQILKINRLTSPGVEAPEYWFLKNYSKKYLKWNRIGNITDPKIDKTTSLEPVKFLNSIPENNLEVSQETSWTE